MSKRWAAATALAAWFIAISPMYAQESGMQPGMIYLKQILDENGRPEEWSKDQRQKFYHTPQGTKLIPYAWFLSLERREGGKFNDGYYLSRFGFIPDPKHDTFNPDELPVGFSKTPIGDRTYLGFNCAFCHTSQLNYTNPDTYQRYMIRIEGGPSRQFNARFLKELMAALRATISPDPENPATLKDPEKFSRFVDGVRKNDSYYSDKDARMLLKEVADTLRGFAGRARIDPIEWGFGRFDALGNGGNTIFTQTQPQGQHDVDNLRVANAPMSIPGVWGAWEYDWIQWNGSIQNRMARSIGEAISIGASLAFLSQEAVGPAVISSVDLDELDRLEKQVGRLRPPPWPEIFPPVNQVKAERGKVLYQHLCERCHTPNRQGDRLVMYMSSLDEIGTDPTAAINFSKRMVNTGVLKGRPRGDNPDEVIPQKMSAEETMEYVTTQIMKQKKWPESQPNRWRAPLAYMARPLAGAWATPPFLHNGSVPNLYQLLSPAEERDACFYLGDYEFDPARIGFTTRRCDGQSRPDDPLSGFEFDTARRGNSNMGHEFKGTSRCPEFSQKGKNGVIGCELKDDQRWAIIEYLKTL